MSYDRGISEINGALVDLKSCLEHLSNFEEFEDEFKTEYALNIAEKRIQLKKIYLQLKD